MFLFSHNLALRLQEEEDAYIASMQQQQEAGGGGAESRPQRPVAPGTAREQQPTGGNGKKDGAKSDVSGEGLWNKSNKW